MVSLAVKRYHDHRYSYKEKHLNEVSLLMRGLVHYYHHGKHDNMQVGMMLEKELRGLHIGPQASGVNVLHYAQLEHRRPQSLPP